jgi:RNA polymerase sigma factor (sigma-70 family)
MESDVALLERWRLGDLAAGSELFERHFECVYRFFKHKIAGDPADLVQRTFLGCVEAQESFRRDASFKTFLLGIARNQLFLHYRAERKAAALDVGASSLEDLSPSASAILVRGQSERVLLQALRSIPLDMQIALELHYWEGMAGPEVASVLDVPEGTVRSRLRRAREALRARVDELEAGERLDSTSSDLESWAESLRSLLRALSET